MGDHTQLTARDIHGPYVQLLTNLQGDNGREWLDALNRFLRKENPWPPVLTHRGHADITLTKKRVPKTYFKDRKGLWVYSGFRDGIVPKAKALDDGTTFSVDYHEITAEGGATDAQIETALGGNYLFDESQVAAIVAELIDQQPGGKPGLLLHKGPANLFYTSALVVIVHWYADDGRWRVGTWRRGGRRWDSGSRVFTLKSKK